MADIKNSPMVVMFSKLIPFAALLALAPAAHAGLILADFEANFFPPSPCDSTDLGDLTNSRLQGTVDFYYQRSRAGDLVQQNPGPPTILDVACGASGRTTFRFDLDLGNGVLFFISFTGDLVQQNPGPPVLPVYAFAEMNPGPPELPLSAPLIELGEFSVGTNPGPPTLPLFAFASPGHDIGTLSVNITAVPEPETEWLLALGLGVMGVYGHRFRPARSF